MRYFGKTPSKAGMAELADAADSKSADPCGHGGSTPPPGTMIINDLDHFWPLASERPKSFDGCWFFKRCVANAHTDPAG